MDQIGVSELLRKMVDEEVVGSLLVSSRGGASLLHARSVWSFDFATWLSNMFQLRSTLNTADRRVLVKKTGGKHEAHDKKCFVFL